MSQVRTELVLDEGVWATATAVAGRRGLSPSVLVEEALRRFVAADDLGALFAELCAADAGLLSDEAAAAIAAEELAAVRGLARSA